MLKAIGAIFLFLVIVAGILVARIILDKDRKETEQSTSFEQKGIIRVALDSYAGYFPLRSEQLISRMLKEGYRLDMVVDEGDYESRVRRMADGEVDLAVFTVDSYILNGAKEDYPGTIVAVLSESQGSDALIARTSVAQTLDDLKEKTDTRISFTPKSPSHHFLKTIGSHFGVEHLLSRRGGWRVESSGSADALNALMNGRADAAVLWEPDISKALQQPGFTKLLGTEVTRGLIVDVLVASRSFLEKRPQDVELLLASYFEVLKDFRSGPQQLVDGIAAMEKVDTDVASSMVDGVEWKSLYENAVEWYGISYDGRSGKFGLYQNIERTVRVLVEAGDFSRSPLPDGDPRRIFFDRIVGRLLMTAGSAGSAGSVSATSTDSVDFMPLSDAAWQVLKPVGTLKVDPIPFNSGSGQVDETGMKSVESVVQRLENYPKFRILVEGHTGTRGDTAANVELSRSRAEAVQRVLVDRFNVDPDRIRAVGLGPARPLRQNSDESIRAWQNRLSRVEVRFLRETL